MGFRPNRFPTMFPVEVVKDGLAQKGFLTNITATGAAILDVRDLSKTDGVRIKSSVGYLDATVQWAENDRCGVRFCQFLGQRQLEKIRTASKTHATINRANHSFTELR